MKNLQITAYTQHFIRQQVMPGDIDMNETGEEGVAREVLEETGLKVKKPFNQFTLPNIYVYSGFPVHTLDMFFLCTVET